MIDYVRSWQKSWDWVHPSYRDLVIDKLSNDSKMAMHYLANGGISAISLALSTEGGAEGKREFPLLRTTESWEKIEQIIRDRVLEVPLGNALRMIRILMSGLSIESPKPLKKLAVNTCKFIGSVWNEHAISLPTSLVRSFLDLAERTGEYIETPHLFNSWEAITTSLLSDLRDCEKDTEGFSPDDMADWLRFIDLIEANEPRLLTSSGRATECLALANEFLRVVKLFTKSEFDENDAEECEGRNSTLDGTLSALRLLRRRFPELDSKTSTVVERVVSEQETVEEFLEQLSPDRGVSGHYDGISRTSEEFDVTSIFTDF